MKFIFNGKTFDSKNNAKIYSIKLKIINSPLHASLPRFKQYDFLNVLFHKFLNAYFLKASPSKSKFIMNFTIENVTHYKSYRA